MSSYNHFAYVEAAVRSVMTQTGVDFEFLVVDDGSTDDSGELLKALQLELGFQLWVRENRGLVFTLNELAQKAQGKWICSIASDDIMPSGRLAAQVAFMEQHGEFVASFGQIQTIDNDGNLSSQVESRYLPGIPFVSFEQLILGVRELHGCTEMIRRDAFLDVGGYPASYGIEDFPLWLRLAEKFGPLPVLGSVHCYYRIHDTNLHRKLDFIYQEVLRILEDYKAHSLYPEARNRWKANWFSSWAYQDKKEALKRLPKLATFSWPFMRRLPKLFIPQRWLRH